MGPSHKQKQASREDQKKITGLTKVVVAVRATGRTQACECTRRIASDADVIGSLSRLLAGRCQ